MDTLINKFFAEAARVRSASISVEAVEALNVLLDRRKIVEQKLRSGRYVHERLMDVLTDTGCSPREAHRFAESPAAEKLEKIFRDLKYFGIRVIAPNSPAGSTRVAMPDRTVPTGYVLVGYYESREEADAAARALQVHLERTLGANPRTGSTEAIAAFKKAITDFLATK